MPISPKFEQMPKPNNKFLRLLADLVLPSDPADAAGDLVGPMMAAERVGGKVAKGLVGEAAENFKRWFGDSKVVDEAGDPLRVFHGTPAGGFDIFDLSKRGTNTIGKVDDSRALHFTNDPSVADTYSRAHENIMPNGDLTREAMADMGISEKVSRNSAIMPTYLAIKKPLVVKNGKAITSDVIAKAKKNGHDGILAINGDFKEYIAFEPTQIKSATGNRGTYDPNDPSIMKSLLPYLMYGLKPNENE